MTLFRKHLTPEMMAKINQMIIYPERNNNDNEDDGAGSSMSETESNRKTKVH